VGTGLGARHNVLIKDAARLEGLSRVDAVIMDKTGTLTEGRPRITFVVPLGLNERELLSVAASAVQGSEHPLAHAIVEGAKEREASLLPPESFQAVAGHGLQARVDGREVVIGNTKLMEDRKISLNGLADRAGELAQEGNTPMFVAVNGRAAGIIAGADVAIETAKVVLMKSDPLDVLRAIKLSKATVRKMIQNLFWASIYNVLAIPIAAGVLYPSLGIELRPEWAALLMSVSSIIVATNAVLLKTVEGELASL